MIIKIQLRDPQTGSEQTFEFDRSPVRVERNALNNIVIEDRFVSQWHGMVSFDVSSVSYFDLEDTALHAEIFGAESARAYASVASEPAGRPEQRYGWVYLLDGWGCSGRKSSQVGVRRVTEFFARRH